MKRSQINPHSTFYVLRSRGATLMETIIFVAIFSLVMVSFITIFVTIVRVQTRQQSAAEVNQQSQFLLQQIQYYIERSSLVELNQDVQTSTLKLRMAASTEDPTYIYTSSSIVYLKQTDSGTPQPLTTNKVNVSSLTFTKRSNAPSHDSVSVSFVVAYNTAGLQQQFSETLQTAIARVYAATFDSNVLPSSTATYKLGATGATWTSVNDVINFSNTSVTFSGVSVGVGTAPSQLLQVGGGGVNGDIYIGGTNGGTGNGIILKKPDGTACARLYYTNTGQLATTSITCT